MKQNDEKPPPNWCYCNFGVYGGTKKEMKDFLEYMEKKIDKQFLIDQEINYYKEQAASDPKKPFTAADEAKIRAGQYSSMIVFAFNDNYTYDEFEEMGNGGMTLRASLESIEDYTDDTVTPHVNIMFESAWSPCEEFFEKFLADNFPNLKMVMIAEEPGNEVYVNTDVEGIIFTDRYKVDGYDDSVYCEDFEHVRDYVESTLNIDLAGEKYDSVNKIQSFLDDYNNFMSDHEMEENQLLIHEYTYE